MKYIVETILFHDFDIIALQEPHKEQTLELYSFLEHSKKFII